MRWCVRSKLSVFCLSAFFAISASQRLIFFCRSGMSICLPLHLAKPLSVVNGEVGIPELGIIRQE